MQVEWNRVTWYSKVIAVLLALIIFGVGFALGQVSGRQSEDISNSNQVIQYAANINKVNQESTKVIPSTIAPAAGIDGDVGNSAISELVGSWQSSADPAQTVVYKIDGTANVLYNGKLGGTFTWKILPISASDQIEIQETSPSANGKLGAQRFYVINKLNDQNLEIVYTYNNEVLKYTKAK